MSSLILTTNMVSFARRSEVQGTTKEPPEIGMVEYQSQYVCEYITLIYIGTSI